MATQAIDAIKAQVSQFHRDYAVGTAVADAFTAWWLHHKHEVATSDAIVRAPGGNYDFGLDGFHLSTRPGEAPVLHLIQGKYSASKQEIKKAILGFDRTMREIRPLLEGGQCDTPTLNPLFSVLAAKLQKENTDLANLRLSFEVLHLSDDAEEHLGGVLAPAYEKFNDAAAALLPDHHVTCRAIAVIREWSPRTGTGRIPPEKQQIRFAGEEIQVDEGVKYFAGLGYLSDLVDLYRANGDALFSKNVRLFLYKSQERGPAKYMRETIRSICVGKARPGDTPERFAILHNGVTLQATSAGRANGGLELRGPSILNGCQTVKNAFLFVEGPTVRDRMDEERWRAIRVPVRVLVTPSEELVRQVTVSNNRQNAIRPSAFRANEPLQLELAEKFREIGIFYERQEQSFVNMQRSRPLELEEVYPNSRTKPLGMEELAQAIAVASEKPALSVSTNIPDLFDDAAYRQVFAEAKLKDLELLVFLRNVLAVAPLALRDLRANTSTLDNLSLVRFRYPASRFMMRWISKHRPELISRYGGSVVGTAGPSNPLRESLRKLMSAQNSGLQQLIPKWWLDESGNWKSATDAAAIAGALHEAKLTNVDVFADR